MPKSHRDVRLDALRRRTTFPTLSARDYANLDSLDDEKPRPDSRNPVKAKPRTAGKKGGEARQQQLRQQARLGPESIVRALNILSAADTPINHPAVGLDLLEELVAVPGLFTMAWRPDLVPRPASPAGKIGRH